MNIFGILTDQTCGEACWHARDEICRCSCGGKNHGILRGKDGVQPRRTAKIAGIMYLLEAVGMFDELYGKAEEINRQAGYKMIEEATLICDSRGTSLHPDAQGLKEKERLESEGHEVYWSQYLYEWQPTDDGAPARIKYSTENQIAKWPELTAWRVQDVAYPHQRVRPALLWVRVVMPMMPSVLVVDKRTGLPLVSQIPENR